VAIFPREKLENEEKTRLAVFAVRNCESVGRSFLEKPDEFRLDFQRDRDRVLHSKSFRRLKGKTQVVTATVGDHFRSRLSHTLEVAQISRSLARNLRANEDLAETIALAHDLGHTPFGHAGETAMNDLLHRFGENFEHNLQSRRIVEKLEEKSPLFSGLNLTFEVRDGLQKHRTPYDRGFSGEKSQPFLEAQIVDLADEIAYQTHDLEDGVRAGILQKSEIEKLEIVQILREKIGENWEISHLVNFLVRDVLNFTAANLRKLNPKSVREISAASEKVVDFSPAIFAANSQLRQFLQMKFYRHPTVAQQSERGVATVKKLFFHFLKNEAEIPEKFRKNEKLEIAAKDFIAGMTDEFAFNFAAKI